MNNKVKIIVDYTNGQYNIIGLNHTEFKPFEESKIVEKDKIFNISKPIRGVDENGYYKASYDNKSIKIARHRMKDALSKLSSSDYCIKDIKNADPALFMLLRNWDEINQTEYATEYLKVITKKYNYNDYKNIMSRKEFKNFCKEQRNAELEKYGIDISYNVGLFNMNTKMNFFDKIRGYLFARTQKNYVGAKMNSALFLNEDYYIDSIEEFIDEINPEDNSFSNISEDENENQLDNIFKIDKNNDIDFVDVFIDKDEIEEKLDIIPENIQEDSSENYLDRLVKENVQKFYSSKEFQDMMAETEISSTSIKNSKMSRKQRIRQAKKDLREQNSHYNTQMRLKFKNENNSSKKINNSQNILSKNEKEYDLYLIDADDKTENVLIYSEPIEKECDLFVIDADDQEINNNQKLIKTSFKRKLSSIQESIHNMQWQRKAKKIAITGILSLAVFGSTASFRGDSSVNVMKDNKASLELLKNKDKNSKNNNTIDIKEVNNNKTPTTDNIEKNMSNQAQTTNTENEEDFNKKINQFKEDAKNKYDEAMVIGQTLQIGDLLKNQTYSEKPDGTGNQGYFANYQDCKISHINIITPDGWKVVRVEGESLSEILAENSDYITYNLAFVNSENNEQLGFVTDVQYEEAVKNKINEIVDEKTNTKTETISDEELSLDF